MSSMTETARVTTLPALMQNGEEAVGDQRRINLADVPSAPAELYHLLGKDPISTSTACTLAIETSRDYKETNPFRRRWRRSLPTPTISRNSTTLALDHEQPSDDAVSIHIPTPSPSISRTSDSARLPLPRPAVDAHLGEAQTASAPASSTATVPPYPTPYLDDQQIMTSAPGNVSATNCAVECTQDEAPVQPSISSDARDDIENHASDVPQDITVLAAPGPITSEISAPGGAVASGNAGSNSQDDSRVLVRDNLSHVLNVSGEESAFLAVVQVLEDKPTLSPQGKLSATPKSYSVVAIDKKYFVSSEMPIPADSMAKWQDSVKTRLEDAICRASRVTHDSEAALALEFYMAGRSRKNLKPSILITCCSSKRKKILKSDLGNLKWLKESGMQYFIRVDKTFGFRTDGTRARDVVIEAGLRSDSSTLCGIPAQMRPSLTGSTIPPGVPFTLGGLVLVGSELCCLTAGHSFHPKVGTNIGPRGPKEIAVDLGADSDSSSFASISSSGDEVTDIRSDNSLPINTTTCKTRNPPSAKRFRKLPHRGIIYGPDTDPAMERDIDTKEKSFLVKSPLTDRTGDSDWALIYLEHSRPILLPNSIPCCLDGSPIFIESTLPQNDLVGGLVWIAAGSGLQEGILNATSASIFAGGAFHEVRQIVVPDSLAQGDSGSWVIQDGRLCGFIVAGRTSQPWAYMVLIDDVFANIRSVDENMRDIRLPTRATLTAMSRALDHQMGPWIPEMPASAVATALAPEKLIPRAALTTSAPLVRKFSIEISRPALDQRKPNSPPLPEKTGIESGGVNRPEKQPQRPKTGWTVLRSLMCCISLASYDRELVDDPNVREKKATKATEMSSSSPSHHQKFPYLVG